MFECRKRRVVLKLRWMARGGQLHVARLHPSSALDLELTGWTGMMAWLGEDGYWMDAGHSHHQFGSGLSAEHRAMFGSPLTGAPGSQVLASVVGWTADDAAADRVFLRST